MAGLWVGSPVGVLLPWGVSSVAPWPLATQAPLAIRALAIEWLSCLNHCFIQCIVFIVLMILF